MGVSHNQVVLYVDCNPVLYEEQYYAPLEPRGFFDATNGYLSVARLVDSPHTVPVSFLILKNYYQK